MAWKTLDSATARYLGAENAEHVIQLLCADCADGNLDFDSRKPFCPIQAAYGSDGEHPSIQWNDESKELRCTEWTEANDGIPA